VKVGERDMEMEVMERRLRWIWKGLIRKRMF
jgi:hypothetical protein